MLNRELPAGVIQAGTTPRVEADIRSAARSPARPQGSTAVPLTGVARPNAAGDRGDRPSPPAPQARGRWLLACAVALLNIALWFLAVPQVQVVDAPARLQGLAYNGYTQWGSPLDGSVPDDATLAQDMQRIAATASRLRTYSSSEMPALPALADQYRVRLTAGVWLDPRADHNQREIDAAVLAARKHASVERIIAGNETQLHRSLTPDQLRAALRQLRARVGVPVSTAEPWHVWLAQPWLADEVDFITVHLLPYWEGVPADKAVDYALQRHQQLRARFPGKRIVIGEAGWPSAGERIGGAHASLANQALFVRQFTARAQALSLDYFLMEAVDQPWKRVNESRVGGHWGLWDVQRAPKFALQGPIDAAPLWWVQALCASALALVFSVPLLMRLRHLKRTSRVVLALAVQAVASAAVISAASVLQGYLSPADVLMATVLLPAGALMALLLVSQALEFAEQFWPASRPPRLLRQASGAAATGLPRVSVHLACSNEPPAMVIATIDSLLALDWPALEIIVVDNNTRDPALWQPVQAHVQWRQAQLATRASSAALRFVHLPHWPGFKAGALNHALALTDPRAQWIAVVDADYVVSPDWLRAVAGHFDDPATVVVQCPQAHRNWRDSRLARMMNFEFDSFFRIGMHHRAARNALVQHGTMTLVRREALQAVGGWDADCICEDTELGLRLLRAGGRVVYVDEVLGTGLLPADFAAYQRQRRRWAQGGMQILRKHGAALLRGPELGFAQRAHFVAGWLPWLADALHLVFSAVAVVWTAGALLAPRWFELPTPTLALALLGACVARWGMSLALHLRCVTPQPADALGALVAAMALSHAVACGVLKGLLQRRAVFDITRKATVNSGDTTAAVAPQAPVNPNRPSAAAVWLLALLGSAAALWASGWPRGDGLTAWTLILCLQALPYLAACVCQQLCAQQSALRWRTAAHAR